ncbi:MAG: DUF4388 domain-containing protein [Candidatus Schekmanbacteria bacterium]|nr:DUF4388 domain-containing protein [Candidatus Schekmanbacteria bacterium]
MALEGTLQDFGLAEIFQLIGLQRKTGILTLQAKEDTVTVTFVDGQLVAAESVERRLEDRLGTVLVNRKSVTEAQLEDALTTQRETLQRLGYVLIKKGYITQNELRSALREQIQQIVYRLFRWKEGYYHFHPEQTVQYDKDNISPLNSETLLLEAARMMDEWPLIQQRVPSPSIVLRRVTWGDMRVLDSRGNELLFEESQEEEQQNDDLPLEMGGAALDDANAQSMREVRLGREEEIALVVIDGSLTAQQIVDRARQPEFDTYKALAGLLDKGLIQKVTERKVEPDVRILRSMETRGESSPVFGVAAGVVVAVALLALIITGLRDLTGTPDPLGVMRPRGALIASSKLQLDHLQMALRLYRLNQGDWPSDLETLIAQAYLRPGDLLDAWGGAVRYGRLPDGYMLTSAGEDKRLETPDDLSVSFTNADGSGTMVFFPPFFGVSTTN